MPREKLAQILSATALVEIAAQQPLDRIRNFIGWTTITHGPGKACMLADGAAQAEVIGIPGAAINFELLAFQSDVGDPVLAATVRAARDVELQLLIKLRQALFQFFHQPARESLGLSNGQFAELAAGAGNGAAPECRGGNVQPGSLKAKSYRRGLLPGHVYHDQVLRVGGAQLAIAVALSQIGGNAQLLRRNTPAQNRRADVKQTGLLLRMHSHVIAKNVIRRMLGNSAVQLVAELALNFLQK